MAARTTRPTTALARDERPLEGHEDFYKRLRDKITMWADRNELKPAYREYLLALPDLFHLTARLALDRRVDAVSKTLVAVALAYAVSPFDLLPDFLGPLGFIDDLLVLSLGIETLLLRVPKKIVMEHWAGTTDIVNLVREIREAADKWVGRGMYLRIRAYLAERGIGKDLGAAKRPPRARAAKAPARKPARSARAAKAAPAARRKAKAKTSGPKRTPAGRPRRPKGRS